MTDRIVGIGVPAEVADTYQTLPPVDENVELAENGSEVSDEDAEAAKNGLDAEDKEHADANADQPTETGTDVTRPRKASA